MTGSIPRNILDKATIGLTGSGASPPILFLQLRISLNAASTSTWMVVGSSIILTGCGDGLDGSIC